MSTDLDPATRARLENWWVTSNPDFRALLAAYDAAVAERDAARMVAKALYDPADIAAKFCHGRPDGLTYSEWCELCPALVALENALGLADEQMPGLKEN